MKLDYGFLKNILRSLQQNESHLMSLVSLARDVEIDLTDDKQFDKFMGHIKLLAENFHVDCANEDLSFTLTGDGFDYCDTDYRLTGNGYELLDILQKDTVFNKIKQFSLSVAFDVGKSLLIKQLAEA